MSNNSPPTAGRFVRLVLIVLILAGVLFYKPAKIKYHQSAMDKAWVKSTQPGAESQDIAAFQKHRNALVRLGYFGQKTYPLHHIRAASAEHRALEKELGELGSKGRGFFAMQGFETNIAPEVTVWARIDDLPAWDSVITGRDRPKSK